MVIIGLGGETILSLAFNKKVLPAGRTDII